MKHLGQPTLDISAIIPVGQRVGDLVPLLQEYADVLRNSGQRFEMIVVFDGPHGTLKDDLIRVFLSSPWLRILELTREFGESAALTAGFAVARGRAYLTLPGYRQVGPPEIQKLMERGSQVDMAVAVRWPPPRSAMARMRRAGFHRLVRFLTGQRYRDLACGMRLFRREIAEEIPLYGDRHHFYPVLARGQGFAVAEVEVERGSGDVFSGPRSSRQYLHRVLDTFSLFFLVRFTKKPLRFFGTVGFLVSALGMIALTVVVVQRLFFEVSLADRPALLLGSLMLVLGVQMFALGFIGELIIFTHARQLKEYAIRRVIGDDSSSTADEPAAAPAGAGGPGEEAPGAAEEPRGTG